MPRRVSMVYFPTCQTHANFSFVRVSVLTSVPACQRCVNYSIWLANMLKGCHFFKYFSKEFFDFWILQLRSTFSNFKNIWAILENLFRKTKQKNKFWHLQNFVKEKSPKISDVVFNGACEIHRTIIQLVWNGAEYIFLFT